MSRNLKEEVALITGAGGGNGLPLAKLFAREGARVITTAKAAVRTLPGLTRRQKLIRERERVGACRRANPPRPRPDRSVVDRARIHTRNDLATRWRAGLIRRF